MLAVSGGIEKKGANTMDAKLADILDRLEMAEGHDDAVLQATLEFLGDIKFAPGLTESVTPESINTSDAAIHLIDVVAPGWSIHIAGRAQERDGHWRCTLRRSSSRDNDEFIGIGKGKVLLHALLAALLRTANFLAGHRQIS
jgi:hypothetical protein